MTSFNIRKKIAKHGKNSIIVIPKLLQEELPPKTIVELTINIIKPAEEKNDNKEN